MKRKLLSMLALLVMAITVQAAPITVTWNYDDITGTGGNSFTKDGVTITTLGFIDYSRKNFMMCKTFTTTLGNFTKIQITGMVNTTNTPSGTGWSGTTWTGNASSVPINGNIYGEKQGNLKIEFTIEPPKVNVSDITLDKTSAEMTVGDAALTLTATVAPDNATDKTVTWTTSDPTVATVADGTVTAVAAGTATITATATNGTADTSDDKTATCTVTVSPQTYNVTVKEGTVDAANWSATPNPATEGQTVTIKYTGTKHVKSIKAVKKAAAATAYTLVESTVGMIVGSDGKAYAVADKDNLPSGVTAVGMVAYKNGSNGLVIALADEANKMEWSTANGATGAAAHTPVISGYSWKLPSKGEWNQMFGANGGNEGSYTGLNTALVTAGGDSSKLEAWEYYWSSTSDDGFQAWDVVFYDFDGSANWYNEDVNMSQRIRACLAF